MYPNSPAAARTILLVAAWLSGCTQVGPAAPGAEPPPAAAAAASAASTAGVAAANPLAVDAGLEILAAGGSAADAAVAIQATLGLVEPQSSGVGGGGFMLYYDAATKKITAFDGREAAPKGASAGMFLDDKGEPLSYGDAVLSGRSTGVPGAIVMLGAVHARHGALPWAKLFEPAIRFAEGGVTVPKRMARFLNMDVPQADQPDVRALFSRADGSPLQAGDRFSESRLCRDAQAHCEPGTARTARIAAARRDHRPHARRAAARHAGCRGFRRLPAADLRAALRPVSRLPRLRAAAALLRRVAPAGARDPRSHGHRGARTNGSAGLVPVRRWRAGSCTRTAIKFVADPEFIPVPVQGMLEPHYVIRRAALIGEKPGPAPAAGNPASIERGARCDERSLRDVPFRRGRSRRQHRVDDDHGRIAVRIGPRGGRLHAEQPAHGFLLSPGRRRRAGRECGRGRQAPAFLDGAGHRARRERKARRRARFAGRHGDPRLQRQDASSACWPGSSRCSRRSTCRT